MSKVMTEVELINEIAQMKAKYRCWTTSDRIVKGKYIGYITFYDEFSGLRIGTYQMLLGTLKDKTISS